ncbi:MAG TPA: hypothetical protein PKK06_03960 [Phycisphaerae bacterium]|nr:hypothetical protein [Phycisphaerae bacterium]HNU44903.1 hypothetical protein [Phycisphaerae bacterium]
MSEHGSHLGLLEQRLTELAAAERAGVFERTPVPAGAAVAAGRTHWRELRRWVLVGLPAAACLALAVGLAYHGLGPAFTPLAGNGAPAEASIYACLTGPGVGVMEGCARYDRDGDGDVDLRDLSEYQLACTRSPK